MTDKSSLLDFALKDLGKPSAANVVEAPQRPAATLAEAADAQQDRVPKSGDITVEVTGLGEDDLQIIFVLVGDNASGTPRLCAQQELIYSVTQSSTASETFSNDRFKAAFEKTRSFQAYYFLRRNDNDWIAAPESPVYCFTQA